MGRLFQGLLALLGLIAVAAVVGYFVLKRPDIPYATLAAKYETSASHYVDLPNGVHLHYREQGDATGPAILLVHGYGASAATWSAWMAKLPTYRTIAIDLPGHGLTSAPAGYQASPQAFVDVIEQFAAAEHLSSFALAGNSMGGDVAWRYAIAHPQRVAALILVDAAGWPEPANAKPPLLFSLISNPVTGPILRDLDNSALIRQTLLTAFSDQSKVNDAMVAQYAELSRAPGHRDMLLQLQSGDFGHASDAALAAIHAPTLILWGREDHIIPVVDAEKFHHAIAGSDLMIFDSVGHVPQEEAPDASAEAVRALLERVQNAEGADIPPPHE